MAETGHARNVANFGTLISFCVGYGVDYKPTNALIQIPSLNALLADAQAALVDVQVKIVPWKNKVADRENIYEGVRPLSTRLLNAFEACGADANKVDNVKTYNRQVHGARAKALPVDNPGTPEDESKGNSVSHQSYVQVAEAFGQMPLRMWPLKSSSARKRIIYSNRDQGHSFVQGSFRASADSVLERGFRHGVVRIRHADVRDTCPPPICCEGSKKLHHVSQQATVCRRRIGSRQAFRLC